MKRKILGIALMLLCVTGIVKAQSALEQPLFHVFAFTDGSYIKNMSDNGKWAVACTKHDTNTLWNTAPKLVDVENENIKELLTPQEMVSTMSCAALDVTDDGSIVAGTYDNAPAIWRKSTGKWEQLPYTNPGVEIEGGACLSITPDGRYAVGRLNYNGFNNETPLLWDLTGETPVLMEVNCPTLGLRGGEYKDQIRLNQISPDGKYAIGTIAYTDYRESFNFICNLENKTWKAIGFDFDAETKKYTAQSPEIMFGNGATFSVDGKVIVGEFYTKDESSIPFVYNMTSESIDFLTAQKNSDRLVTVPGTDGVIYGATPSSTPIRDWCAFIDGYWYNFSDLLMQVYGLDYESVTGFENTGTVVAISGDNRKLAVFPSTVGESYVVELPEPFKESSAKIDLLSNYMVTPANKSSFTKLKTVELKFDYDVKVLGNVGDIVLKDNDGKTFDAMQFETAAGNNKIVQVSFRTITMEQGKTYTLTIPAGTLCLENDSRKTNKELTIKYTGRENAPVKPVKITPEEGLAIPYINVSELPVLVTFDATVSLLEGASAQLYAVDEKAGDQLISEMQIAVAENQAMITPVMEQKLYLGTDYKVVVRAGSVGDLTGINPNEEFTINYKGSYERRVQPDKNILFENDFNDTSWQGAFMFYEGDHNTPDASMIGLGFQNKDQFPWWVVKDNDASTDWAIASHSIYNPKGKSDDWMVIPQIYIPDDRCVLVFDAQSYRKSKADKLKVLVWENENVINFLSPSTIEQYRAAGVTVFDEQLLPGDNEDTIDGDWQHKVVELKQFAGKNIYIAFINENEDQSMVFIDNIKVERDTEFLVALDTESTMVRKSDCEVLGRVTIKSESSTYENIELTLCDVDGKEISKISESGLSLKNGDVYSFKFNDKLPLKFGEINTYTVKVKLNDSEVVGYGSIKNLSFATTKRIVLEEATGQGCVNCPLGIAVIEKMKKTYGDRFIPLSLHTYDGDNLGVGLSNYSNFLGLKTTPTGRINRNEGVLYPAISEGSLEDMNYLYSTPNEPGNNLWWDVAKAEFLTYADADINVTRGGQYDKEAKTMNIPVEIKYAYNASGLNVNIAAVVLENQVRGIQSNGFSSTSKSQDNFLAEWQKGGEFGSSMVRGFMYDEVVRQFCGTTYNGISGQVPTDVESGKAYPIHLQFNLPQTVDKPENCEIVVMLIDVNTGKIINAVKSKVYDVASVENIADADKAQIKAINGGIEVVADSEAVVELYGVNGMLLGTVKGVGAMQIATSYKGMAVVRVVSGNQATIEKVVIK